MFHGTTRADLRGESFYGVLTYLLSYSKSTGSNILSYVLAILAQAVRFQASPGRLSADVRRAMLQAELLQAAVLLLVLLLVHPPSLSLPFLPLFRPVFFKKRSAS